MYRNLSAFSRQPLPYLSFPTLAFYARFLPGLSQPLESQVLSEPRFCLFTSPLVSLVDRTRPSKHPRKGDFLEHSRSRPHRSGLVRCTSDGRMGTWLSAISQLSAASFLIQTHQLSFKPITSDQLIDEDEAKNSDENGDDIGGYAPINSSEVGRAPA